MSLRSWKQEFYPVTAKKLERSGASEEALVEHSLRKWLGLRPAALRKHDVLFWHSEVTADSWSSHSSGLYIDAASCALCARHLRDASDPARCNTCPLYRALGCRPCDVETPEGNSPYGAGIAANNPEPMINALRAAKRVAKRLDREHRETEAWASKGDTA